MTASYIGEAWRNAKVTRESILIGIQTRNLRMQNPALYLLTTLPPVLSVWSFVLYIWLMAAKDKMHLYLGIFQYCYW